MKALWKVGLPAALIVSWCLLSEGQGAAPRAAVEGAIAERPGDDVQDVIFLSEARPLLVRLHVRIDGVAYKLVWERFMDKLFRYLDANGDGVLSKAEAERAPPVQTLFNTGFFGGGGGPVMGMMDTNRDGKVSRAELADYYRRNGAAPFQFRQGGARRDPRTVIFLADGGRFGGGTPSADALNDRLFALLDKNKDGKLSKAELAAAPAILARLDVDDDEMLTPEELMGDARPRTGEGDVFFTPALVDYSKAPGRAPGPFHVVISDRGDTALARRLLSQYGAKGARKLTAKQLGLDRDTFARLDADGDGELDAEELARFSRGAPDLEFIIRLGQRGAAPLVEHVKRPGRPAPADRYVAKGKNGLPVIDVNNTRVELGGLVQQMGPGIVRPVKFNVRQQYIDQFKAADKDNNGYLDEAEARASPFFRGTFKLMDRDGDGMLYLKEVIAYLDTMESLSSAGMKSIVSMGVSDLGRGLFDLLDTDRDGRLSVREVRQLPKLIEMLDRDGDGCLSKHEVPRYYRASFEQGPSNVPPSQFRVVAFGGGMGPARPLPQRTAGPLWFRKMDRNRDGDVSRREFLGTDEEFRRIDTDGDGRISVEEAIAYDKLKRAARKE